MNPFSTVWFTFYAQSCNGKPLRVVMLSPCCKRFVNGSGKVELLLKMLCYAKIFNVCLKIQSKLGRLWGTRTHNWSLECHSRGHILWVRLPVLVVHSLTLFRNNCYYDLCVFLISHLPPPSPPSLLFPICQNKILKKYNIINIPLYKVSSTLLYTFLCSVLC